MKMLSGSVLSALTVAAVLSTSAFAKASSTAPSSGITPFTTVVQNDEKENLVADQFDRTLYVFDVDQGSPASNCNGDCAEHWPPFILDAAEAKTLTAPLGSIVRANKTVQLTFEGRPVYTYAFDRVKGDDHGDGIGGVWHYIEIK